MNQKLREAKSERFRKWCHTEGMQVVSVRTNRRGLIRAFLAIDSRGGNIIELNPHTHRVNVVTTKNDYEQYVTSFDYKG